MGTMPRRGPRSVFSVVVPTPGEGVSGVTEDREDRADDDQYDADAPQDGELEQETCDQRDDAENDHDEPPLVIVPTQN